MRDFKLVNVAGCRMEAAAAAATIKRQSAPVNDSADSSEEAGHRERKLRGPHTVAVAVLESSQQKFHQANKVTASDTELLHNNHSPRDCATSNKSKQCNSRSSAAAASNELKAAPGGALKKQLNQCQLQLKQSRRWHQFGLVSLVALLLELLSASTVLNGRHGSPTNGGLVLGANADIFSSTSHLQNLMYLERHLIVSLGEYVAGMEKKLTKIKRYIDHWESTAGREEFIGTYSEDEIVGNPLQAFQLVKRLTIDWRSISDMFKQDSWNEVAKITHEYSSIMPKDDDLHGAALAIVRLQDTYNLTERELAMGKIQDQATRVEMTARDCLYLAKHAFNNAYYGHSLDWFEEALRRAYSEGNSTASVSEIQPFYQMAGQVVEQFRRESREKGTSLDTYHIYMEASGSKEHSTKFKMLDDDNEDYRKYQALCRGEKRRTAKQEARLKCYLRHNNHPLLYLQPIRIEVQNLQPYISIIHNLMSPKEAEMIRELAAPLLTRARVQTDNGTMDMVSKTRTSQTAWFSPDTHPIVNRMNRRIEAATGLSADMRDSHCELMQVANYGMGGHYTPHYDYLIVDRPEEERDQVDERELYAGDRTATVMFYLKDVVRGGSTVFPRLGVQLKPELGAAAFWYNLYRNGEGMIETVHGACPVLMGEKWVANFWIRERGQFTKRPCSLNPKE